MKVKELIARLQEYDPELPIALRCMGHTYLSGCHDISHGKMTTAVGCDNYPTRHLFIGHMQDYGACKEKHKHVGCRRYETEIK